MLSVYFLYWGLPLYWSHSWKVEHVMSLQWQVWPIYGLNPGESKIMSFFWSIQPSSEINSNCLHLSSITHHEQFFFCLCLKGCTMLIGLGLLLMLISEARQRITRKMWSENLVMKQKKSNTSFHYGSTIVS